LEVWATHETHDEKRQYCLDQGYSFAEFHADHVLEAHKNAPHNSVFKLENLKIQCFECKDCAHARKQTAIQNEKAKLAAIASAERVRISREQFRLLEITREQQRKKRELSDREFYDTTCAGAETRILQLQTELYEKFALQGFRDSVKSKTAHQIPLDVYVYEEDDILLIGHPTGWRNFHTQKERDRELLNDAKIANGSVRLDTQMYEKGVSFKCICKKWVHPSKSFVKGEYAGIYRDGCVDVYKEQMNPLRFELMVQEGIRKHDYYSDNPYIKLCGLCANICIFCEKGILQTQASGYGCCYPCLMNVPANIKTMQAQKRAAIFLQITGLRQKIAKIYAGNPFRGFFDFAIEYSLRQQEIENKRKLQHEIKDIERKLRHGIEDIERKLQQELEDIERMLQQEIKDIERILQQEIKDIERILQQEADKRMDEMKTMIREGNRKQLAVHNKALEEKTLEEKVLQEKYDKWVISQADNLRKRKERDEQSHQRWVRSRTGLQ